MAKCGLDVALFFWCSLLSKTWLALFWRNTLGSPSLMMNLLIVFDVDIFSSHRGDARQSEIAQMERCLIFCMVKQVEKY